MLVEERYCTMRKDNTVNQIFISLLICSLVIVFPSGFFERGYCAPESSTSFDVQISNISPLNGSKEVGLIPWLSMTLSQTKNKSLSVEWWSNETNRWIKFASMTVLSDMSLRAIQYNFSQIETKYYWSVNITDGVSWINKTFWFISQQGYFCKKWETTIPYYSWSPMVAENIENEGFYGIFIGGRNGTSYKNKVSPDGLVCIDGNDGSIRWNKVIDFDGLYMPCAIDDLDNDDNMEIVHSSGNRTIARNCEDGSELWNVSLPSAWGQLAIARFDDNIYPYVIVGSNSVHELNPSIKKIYGNNGTLAKSNSIIYYICHGGISIADLDLDGDFEIVVSDAHENYCFNEDLEVLWKTKSYSSESHAAILINITGDERLEVLILEQSSGSSPNGGIHVYYSNGSEVPGMNEGHIGLGCHSQPSVCDIDKDGHIEVITSNYGTSYGASDVKVWDLSSWSLDAILEKSSEPPNCENVIGDEDFEIVSCAAFTDDDTDLYNKNYQIISTIADYGTSTLTQDIDHDGLNEIIFNKPQWTDCYDYGIVSAWDTVVPCQNQRTDTSHYSERRTSVAEYIPKIGGKCILSNEYPPHALLNVSINISQVAVTIQEPDNDFIFWSIETSPDIGHIHGMKELDGTKICNISNLAFNTKYTWYVNCSDGTNYLNEQYFFQTEIKNDTPIDNDSENMNGVPYFPNYFLVCIVCIILILIIIIVFIYIKR